MPQTPEEKAVNEIVKEARKKDFKDIFHYQGPTSQPTPPEGGMSTGPRPGIKMTAEKAKEIEKHRQEALNKSADAIRHAPINTQVKAFKIVDAYAYPNTAPPPSNKDEKSLDQSQDFAKQQFKGKHKEEKPPTKEVDEAMRFRQAEKKDIEPSQDYAMRILGDEKEKERRQPQKEAAPSKKESLSFSFSQSLGYSKLHKPLDKSPDVQAPQKTEMSGKAFSDSLGYNNISKAPVEPSPTVASKFRDNSIDMDI